MGPVTATLDAQQQIGDVRRWAILAVTTAGQTAATMLVVAPSLLIPAMHDDAGLSLAQAGLVAAAPTFGMLLALYGWGWLTDRTSERGVLLSGLSGTALAAAAAALTHSPVVLGICLVVGGAFAASANAASGRVVVGWFPPHRRGLAMGVRQVAPPLGAGLAAVTLTITAERHGPYAAHWIPAAACALVVLLIAAVVIDPPRPDRHSTPAANPYRGDAFLPRIHGASVLLNFPQTAMGTFALVWLVQDRGWAVGAAGTLIALTQVLGALVRIGSGQLSDSVRSRVRPVRWISWSIAATMLLLAVAAGTDSALAVPLMVAACVFSVAPNGLAAAAIAEHAGPFWSGRALGLQNTVQFLVSTAVPPLGGLLIADTGYAWTFALVALFPLLAVAVVPVRGEHSPR